MPLCSGCNCRLGMGRSKWANGLAYCFKCIKIRKQRETSRKKPGAIQMGSSMANLIVVVNPPKCVTHPVFHHHNNPCE